MTSMMTVRRGAMAKPTAFSPSSIAGLGLWVDASQITGLADGDPVATWSDLSGNGRNFAQATSAQRPTYKVSILNGKPVVRFDGVDDRLDAAYVVAQGLSVFSVLVPRTNTGTPAYYDDVSTSGSPCTIYRGAGAGNYTLNAGTDLNSGTAVATGTPVVTGGIYSAASSVVTINGTSASGAAGSSGYTVGPRLGCNRLSGNFAQVDFAEYLIYNSALSSTNRRLVEAYLGAKYGITVV
jgi:hypothetical protein